MALWGLPSKYLLQFRLIDIGLVRWWASAPLWKPKFRERQDRNYFYSSSYSSSQKSLRQGVNFQVCLLNKWKEKDLYMHIHTCVLAYAHMCSCNIHFRIRKENTRWHFLCRFMPVLIKTVPWTPSLHTRAWWDCCQEHTLWWPAERAPVAKEHTIVMSGHRNGFLLTLFSLPWEWKRSKRWLK